MKILLVRPNPPKESINLQSFMICEPLELEYVASALINNDNEVDLVDMILEKQSLKKIFLRKDYQMVCFTSYITTIGVVKTYAKMIKQLNHRCVIVVGGVHAEVVPTDFVDPNIDYIVWANGVETIAEMVNEYPDIDETFIPGIYVEGKDKPELNNSKLKAPNRQITKRYRNNYSYIYHDHCATIKTSYGCPYHCNFCFCTQVCSYSTRIMKSVMDELASIEEKNVFIVDDNFLVDRDRIISFCNELDKRKIQKHFIAFGRADFIANNEDIIILLHNHGFDAFFVGIESFKNEELEEFSKKASVEENMKAIKILEDNGLQCYSGLIVNEDWHKADFNNLITYLNGFEHPLVNIQPLTPMPGTPLFDNPPFEVILKRDNYACWDMAHLAFNPTKMSKRAFYYNIVRAYLKTSANRKQREFIKSRYGVDVYKRVKKGAWHIFFQYVKLMINPK